MSIKLALYRYESTRWWLKGIRLECGVCAARRNYAVVPCHLTGVENFLRPANFLRRPSTIRLSAFAGLSFINLAAS